LVFQLKEGRGCDPPSPLLSSPPSFDKAKTHLSPCVFLVKGMLNIFSSFLHYVLLLFFLRSDIIVALPIEKSHRRFLVPPKPVSLPFRGLCLLPFSSRHKVLFSLGPTYLFPPRMKSLPPFSFSSNRGLVIALLRFSQPLKEPFTGVKKEPSSPEKVVGPFLSLP